MSTLVALVVHTTDGSYGCSSPDSHATGSKQVYDLWNPPHIGNLIMVIYEYPQY